MNCDAAREAMLVAEPGELRIGEDGALGQHLSECAQCRATAQYLSHDLKMLSAAIGVRRSSRTGRAKRVALFASIPAAAALIVGAALLNDHGPSGKPAGPAATSAEKIVSVDIKRGQQATVLRTSDPTVTVVWISQESEP